MQCPNCNAELDDNATECNVCGTSLASFDESSDGGSPFDAITSAFDHAETYRKAGEDTASAVATLASTVGSLIPGTKSVTSSVAQAASSVGSALASIAPKSNSGDKGDKGSGASAASGATKASGASGGSGKSSGQGNSSDFWDFGDSDSFAEFKELQEATSAADQGMTFSISFGDGSGSSGAGTPALHAATRSGGSGGSSVSAATGPAGTGAAATGSEGIAAAAGVAAAGAIAAAGTAGAAGEATESQLVQAGKDAAGAPATATSGNGGQRPRSGHSVPISIKTRKSRRYFDKPHYLLGIIVIVFGASMLVVGIGTLSSANVVPGIGIIVFGLLFIIQRKFSTTNDKVIEDIYAKMRNQPRGEALEELGIASVDKKRLRQMFFSGCTARDVPAPAIVRFGGDYKLRTSNYSVSLLYFTANMMYCYSLTQSLVEERYLTETMSMAYDDIVSIETSNKISSKSQPGSNGVCEFTVSASNGARLTIPYSPDDPRQQAQFAALHALLYAKPHKPKLRVTRMAPKDLQPKDAQSAGTGQSNAGSPSGQQALPSATPVAPDPQEQAKPKKKKKKTKQTNLVILLPHK